MKRTVPLRAKVIRKLRVLLFALALGTVCAMVAGTFLAT
jgi:hypothetical protein